MMAKIIMEILIVIKNSNDDINNSLSNKNICENTNSCNNDNSNSIMLIMTTVIVLC